MDPESGDWPDVDQEFEEVEGEEGNDLIEPEPATMDRRTTVIDPLEAIAAFDGELDDSDFASAADFADEDDLASADDLNAVAEPAGYASEASEPVLSALIEEVLEDSGIEPHHANYDSTRQGVAAQSSFSIDPARFANERDGASTALSRPIPARLRDQTVCVNSRRHPRHGNGG